MEHLGQNVATNDHIVMLSHREWNIMCGLAIKLMPATEVDLERRMINWRYFFSLCEAIAVGKSLTVTTSFSVNEKPFPMLDIESITDC